MIFQMIVSALGIWLMAAPATLGLERGPGQMTFHITGPLVACFSCIAIWEVTRPLRWVSAACGAALVVLAPILDLTASATVASLVTGAVIVALCLPRGKTETRYGGGWSALWKSGERKPSGETP